MTSKRRIIGLAVVCVAGLARGALAAPTCNNPAVLHLVSVQRSASSVVVERRDSVSVDRMACYQLNIRGGSRTLSVHLFSNDSAGFLRLYTPDWTTRRVGGSFVFTGANFPGAAEADHATKWKGPAPVGNILIVVDMSGAGRQYRLRVEAY